jgi:predicted ester cyclase
MRDQKDTAAIYMMPVFESEEKARARERDSQRDEELKPARAIMAEIFEGPPEFVDLEVIAEYAAGTAEQNKAVFRRLMDEIFNDGKLDLIEEVISPDWVNIDPTLPPLRGHEGARQLVTLWRNGFPGFTIEIEDMVAEGDKVAARFSFTGKHTGEFLGIPPTGKDVHGTGTGIFRFENGKDVEHQVNFDALGVLQQLGVVPVPETASA